MKKRNRSKRYLRMVMAPPPPAPPAYPRMRLFVGDRFEIFTASGAWWFWQCQKGELPESPATGPFKSAAIAAKAATEAALEVAPAATVVCGGER